MSAIFLSHSSVDNDAAASIKRHLEAHGHTVFLDFDPEAGIAGGDSWEKTLSERIERCQAVVPLISPAWLSSRWCVAELFHARAIGKAIVPVTIRSHGEATWLAHLQQIDLTRDERDGLTRLLRALEDVHPLVPGRPPYPGLASYTEDDAAVFFGRHQETSAGMEGLESLRRRGASAPRLLLVLGASGSGKSSLVRAGLVPRLRRRTSDWLVLPVVRPRLNALDEFVTSLALAYAGIGQPRDRATLTERLLENAADARTPPLLDAVRDLRIAAQAPNATTLLVIDQLEELFTPPLEQSQSATFVTLLRRALDRSTGDLIVVGTMRSDFLGTFQLHAFTREAPDHAALAWDQFTVDPLPPSRVEDVIRGPASRFGVTVDPKLVNQLITDLPTADSLPLLAFTLRRLWIAEETRPDGRLDLRDYDAEGGLKGTIETAVREALPKASEQEDILRSAFIPALVNVDIEGMRTRRRARLDKMPPASRPLLERLIDARLLVPDKDQHGHDTVEVTHEALFRMWPALNKWIDDNEYELRALDGIVRAARDWHREQRAELLVHRDGRLSEALRTVRMWSDAGVPVQLDAVAQRYLDHCVAAQKQRDEAARSDEERRLRDAQIIWRRTAIGAGVAMLAVMLTVVVLWLTGSLVRIRATARDNQRLALSRVWAGEDPTIAGLILNEIEDPASLNALDVAAVALDVINSPAWWVELPHAGPVRWVDVSRDGKAIVTASADKTARVWPADGSGAPQILRHDDDVLRAVFSPNGQFIVTATLNGSVRVWRADNGTAVADLDHQRATLYALAFSADGSRLLTGTFDGVVRVWSTDSNELLREHRGQAPVTAVAFDASGNRWVAGGEDGALRLGAVDASSGDAVMSCRLGRRVAAAGVAPNGSWIAAVMMDGSVLRIDPATTREGAPCARSDEAPATTLVSAALNPSANNAVTLQGDGVFTMWSGLSRGTARSGGQSEASFVAFSPTGASFATAHANGRVEIRRAAQPERSLTLASHARAVRHVAFSADGTIVATASDDNTARVWRVDDSATAGLVVISHPRNVSDAGFSADGQQVLSASTRGDVRLTKLDGTTVDAWRFSHPNTARGAREAAVSPRSDWVLSVGGDGVARMWPADPATQRRTRELEDPEDPGSDVLHARFNADGARVITASSDGTARVWSVDREGDAPLRLRGHNTGKPLHAASFSAIGDLIVTASADSTARLWNATTGTAVTDGQGRPLIFAHGAGFEVLDAAFDHSGDRVVTAATDNAARIWSVGGGAPIELRHPKAVRIAAFSPDGTRVVTACDDGIVRVWPADGSGTATQLNGHVDDRRIVTAVFSGNGARILTASQDATARIWNADGTGNPIVLRHPEALAAAAFSPAADQVVTGSADSKARIWTLAPAPLLNIIRSRTRTCLSPEFRVRHFLEGDQEAAKAFQACQARVASVTQ